MSNFAIWHLTSKCDLDLCRRDLNFPRDTPPYYGEHLCQVISKSLYACRSYTPDTGFGATPKCDLDLWMADLNVAHDTQPGQVVHIYQIILKSIKEWARYRPEKSVNFHFSFDLWPLMTLTYIFVHNNSTHHGEHLCQVISKSINKHRRYTLDECQILPFDLWPLSVTLTFVVETWIFRATFRLTMENICVK